MKYSHVRIKNVHFTNNKKNAIIVFGEEKHILNVFSSNIILRMKSGAALCSPFPILLIEQIIFCILNKNLRCRR